MLKVPIVKKIFKDPKINKKGVYNPSAIKPMEMLAATFGIALVRGTGNPFPTLTLEVARESCKKDDTNKDKRDTCAQIQWCIQNNSIGVRLRKLEKVIKHIGADAKIVLARAGKTIKIKDCPYSIATNLPRRTKGIWDENKRNCKDKIVVAIKLRQPLSPKEKRRIQQETQRKTQREETLFQKRMKQKKRPALSNIINTAGKDNREKTINREKHRARDELSKTEEQHTVNSSPKKASRTYRAREANQGKERDVVDMIKEGTPKTASIMEIELSGDEQEENIAHEMKTKHKNKIIHQWSLTTRHPIKPL